MYHLTKESRSDQTRAAVYQKHKSLQSRKTTYGDCARLNSNPDLTQPCCSPKLPQLITHPYSNCPPISSQGPVLKILSLQILFQILTQPHIKPRDLESSSSMVRNSIQIKIFGKRGSFTSEVTHQKLYKEFRKISSPIRTCFG